MSMIRSFTRFLNSVHADLVQKQISPEDADRILDQVDAFEYYCQNTTMTSDADPSAYADIIFQIMMEV